jgi:hypothetical protein
MIMFLSPAYFWYIFWLHLGDGGKHGRDKNNTGQIVLGNIAYSVEVIRDDDRINGSR